MRGFRLTGLRFFHVIANLIFGVFLRRAGISAKRAIPPNRASPAHVIGLLDLLRTNSSKITFELTLLVRFFEWVFVFEVFIFEVFVFEVFVFEVLGLRLRFRFYRIRLVEKGNQPITTNGKTCDYKKQNKNKKNSPGNITPLPLASV